MDNNQKLKYYLEIKDVLPGFLLANFDRMSLRKKIIFYNTIKDNLTDEQKNELLSDLCLDLTSVEDSIKKLEEFRYILVGNIIDKHYYGENKEIKSGTKHFRAGAKVYLLPKFGGNGHIDIPVYGLPRNSRKKINIVIRASMIKNIRVKKTFDPKLIAKIDDSFFYDYFDNDETGLKGFADAMNEIRMKNNLELDEDTKNNG